MDEAARPLCIAAINAYRAAHFTALVVCSRSAEYHAAVVHQRLALQNAVVVQPLTREQIEEVIQQGGEALAALCQALGDSQELLDLATTPLMLSVLVLAYHGTTVNDLPQQQATLEHRIWTDYVKRMVCEKGAERQSKSDTPTKIYSLEQTRSWLSWLAQQMQVHNQTLFYGESLLEEWLPASQQQKTRWLVVSLPAMLLGTCVSLLLSFFLISASSPVGLCQIGIIGGFLGWCACANQPQHVSARAQQAWWRRAFWIQCLYLLRAGGLAILAVGCFGLYGTGYTMSDWALVGIYIGIPLLVTAWLLQMVLLRLAPLPSHSRPTPRWGHWAGWLRTTATRRALWTGLIFSIGGAVTEWLSYSPSDVKPFDLSYVLMTGLAYGWLIYFVT